MAHKFHKLHKFLRAKLKLGRTKKIILLHFSAISPRHSMGHVELIRLIAGSGNSVEIEIGTDPIENNLCNL